jgi:hypothetical protein
MEMGTNWGKFDVGKHVHPQQIPTDPLRLSYNTTPNQSQPERNITKGSANTAQLPNHHPQSANNTLVFARPHGAYNTCNIHKPRAIIIQDPYKVEMLKRFLY